MAYHSDVEAYVMTRQLIAQSPDYTPSTNGPLGLGCPRRAPGDYECGDHSACTDFGLYCHVAARNAKDKYAVRLVDQAGSGYYGWPGGGAYWRDNVVEPLIEPMLRDAILVTAQFLVGWMQFAKQQMSYSAYGDGWKNISNGYLTSVSAAADGTVWGVNAQMPTTDPEGNVFQWNGSGWDRKNGYLTCIAVGSKSEVWGVNAQMPSDQTNIARWNGSSWDSVGGYLTQIAVAPDGAVMGVNALQFPDVQNVYVWRGKDQPWGGITGHLTQISPISASQFCGVNAEQYSYPGV